MGTKHLLLYVELLSALILTGCAKSPPQHESFVAPRMQASLASRVTVTDMHNPAFWSGDSETVWARLQETSQDALSKETPGDKSSAAWTELAIISKRDSLDSKTLAQNLLSWRAQNKDHPGNTLIPSDTELQKLINQTEPKHITVLVPLTGPYASLGKSVRDGIMSAYYESVLKTNRSQEFSFLDTNTEKDMAALYQKAIANGADVVIGPLTKENVTSLTNYGNLSKPTLALNYTDTQSVLPNNLYQFGLSPLDEAMQLADKAKNAGYSRALLIVAKNDWSDRVAKTLKARWQANGGNLADEYYFTSTTDLTSGMASLLHVEAKKDLDKVKEQSRKDYDVVFLLAPPVSARQIVPLLKFYSLESKPVYATSVIYSGQASPQNDMDLNGVKFCDIREKGNRFIAVGKDAYRLTNEIERINTLSHFPMHGSTGDLTLSAQKQIYRRLSWEQFHDGNI